MRVLTTVFVVAVFIAALALATQGRFALAMALGVFSAAFPLLTRGHRSRLPR